MSRVHLCWVREGGDAFSSSPIVSRTLLRSPRRTVGIFLPSRRLPRSSCLCPSPLQICLGASWHCVLSLSSLWCRSCEGRRGTPLRFMPASSCAACTARRDPKDTPAAWPFQCRETKLCPGKLGVGAGGPGGLSVVSCRGPGHRFHQGVGKLHAPSLACRLFMAVQSLELWSPPVASAVAPGGLGKRPPGAGLQTLLRTDSSLPPRRWTGHCRPQPWNRSVLGSFS